jgi:hypothetical protein
MVNNAFFIDAIVIDFFHGRACLEALKVLNISCIDHEILGWRMARTSAGIALARNHPF